MRCHTTHVPPPSPPPPSPPFAQALTRLTMSRDAFISLNILKSPSVCPMQYYVCNRYVLPSLISDSWHRIQACATIPSWWRSSGENLLDHWVRTHINRMNVWVSRVKADKMKPVSDRSQMKRCGKYFPRIRPRDRKQPLLGEFHRSVRPNMLSQQRIAQRRASEVLELGVFHVWECLHCDHESPI